MLIVLLTEDALIEHQTYNKDRASIPVKVNYASTTTAFLGPQTRTREYQDLTMEVEDQDGYNVEKVKFAMPLNLRNLVLLNC